MGERKAFFFFFSPISSGAKNTRNQTSLELDLLCSFCSQGLVLPSIRHTWQSWEVWAVTGFNCYLEKCGRRHHLEVSEINQIAWTPLHRDSLMSVCALKQRRLLGNLTQAYLTFFPNWSEKTQAVIYKRGDKAAQRPGAGKRSKS